MKALKWIWWLGAVFYGLISAGYAIGFAGYGLSLWQTKPDPDAFILAVAFMFSAAWAIVDAVEDYPARTPQESATENDNG